MGQLVWGLLFYFLKQMQAVYIGKSVSSPEHTALDSLLSHFLQSPWDRLLNFWGPRLPHHRRGSWNYRSSKVPTTHSALCLPILSFCGWFIYLALGVARVGDGTRGHRTGTLAG